MYTLINTKPKENLVIAVAEVTPKMTVVRKATKDGSLFLVLVKTGYRAYRWVGLSKTGNHYIGTSDFTDTNTGSFREVLQCVINESGCPHYVFDTAAEAFAYIAEQFKD